MIRFLGKQLHGNIGLFGHAKHNMSTILNEYVNILNKFTLIILKIHFHLGLDLTSIAFVSSLIKFVQHERDAWHNEPNATTSSFR